MMEANMSTNQQALASLAAEVPLNSSVLRSVPFSRNRFLATAGAVLVAAATRLWFAKPALAVIPNGCFGWHWCPSCSGTTCTASGCTKETCCCPPDNVANQCWQTCAYWGSQLSRFYCCDWRTSGGTGCICRGYVGLC
jgi:hypothetical protein